MALISVSLSFLIVYIGLFILFILFVLDPLVSSNASDIANGNMFGYRMMNLVMRMGFVAVIVFVALQTFGIFTKQVAIFEHRRWFGALGKSIKTIVKGNFWATLGYLFLFGFIMMMPYFAIMTLMAFASKAFGSPAGGLGMSFMSTQFLSGNTNASIAIFAIIKTIVYIAFVTVYTGLTQIFTTLIYFNARTRSEKTPFPEPQNDEEIAFPKDYQVEDR